MATLECKVPPGRGQPSGSPCQLQGLQRQTWAEVVLWLAARSSIFLPSAVVRVFFLFLFFVEREGFLASIRL